MTGCCVLLVMAAVAGVLVDWFCMSLGVCRGARSLFCVHVPCEATNVLPDVLR